MNHEAQSGSPVAGLIAAVAVSALLAGVLAVVLERIGASPRLLTGAVAVLAAGGLCLAALSGGTMRLPIFLTAGRSLSGAAVGLAFAIATPRMNTLPETVVAAAGLFAFALLVAPALQRSGAISIPTFLAARYGGRFLRLLAAILVAGAGLTLGAVSLGRAADVLGRMLTLPPEAAIGLCATLLLLPLAAAGASGMVRGLAIAASIAVFACIVVLAIGQAAGSLVPISAQLAGAGRLPFADGAAILAGVAALPHVASLSAAAQMPPRWWTIALSSAAACLLFGLGATAIPAGEPTPPLLFAVVAGAALQVVAPLAVALALIGAAGVALGYDLPGRRDRLRVSTSRRFAQLRLAMIVMTLAAAWLASARAPWLTAGAPWAAAALVAGVLPAVLLTLLRPSAGPGAAGTAMLLGLGAAALASDPQVWGPAGPPAPFAVVGLVIGLAAGLAVAFVAPAAKPAQPAGDAAL